ncbi:MAG: TonB C-terminal domain-containing protein [Kofleriaceae bacterium]|nr:TonB C-terminal domain-containing protein [Kofleriaceae bacterium]
MSQASQHRRGAVVVVVALAVHAAVFGIWQAGQDPAEVAGHETSVTSLDTVPLAVVEVAMLSGGHESLEIVESEDELASASDQEGELPENALRDFRNTPGTSPGRRAAGQAGQATFVPRQDRDYRSKSLWNANAATEMQNTANAKLGKQTPESVEKRERPGYSEERILKGKRRTGGAASRTGHREGAGEGGLPGESGQDWFASDPQFDIAPLAATKKREGAASPSPESPRVDQGTRSTENSERGIVESQASAKARSSQKSPSIFDLGAPSRRGQGKLGAGGSDGRSVATHSGDGSAAQAGAGTQQGLAATRASKSNPYFFEMYRRIDKEVTFPRKLALALEQGELVVRMRLSARGEIESIRLSKKSGYTQFDIEALRAFRKAAPFGPVPVSLLAGRTTLRVIAPYYFRNRIIR